MFFVTGVGSLSEQYILHIKGPASVNIESQFANVANAAEVRSPFHVLRCLSLGSRRATREITNNGPQDLLSEDESPSKC